ncbi:MAG: hypothetical protein AAF215_04115 [Cyanobacteria bacterium P01_A01_bin.123]
MNRSIKPRPHPDPQFSFAGARGLSPLLKVSNRMWFILSVLAVCTAWFTPAAVLADEPEEVNPQIQALRGTIATALCLNEWDLAMDLTSQLMATEGVNSVYRTELVRFRGQIQTWAFQNEPIRFQGCDDEIAASMVYVSNPQQVAEAEAEGANPPLDWAGAYESYQLLQQSSF